jgi:putative transposase
VTPFERREAVRVMHEQGLSVARACQAARLSRAAYYRQGVDRASRDRPVMEALNGVVAEHHRWGFWKCYDRLRNTGHGWNHKRLWRVYRAMKLNLPRRTKRRLPARVRQPLTVVALPNQVGSLDFMSDALWGGRRFRTLNVLDEGVREGLAIEVDTSLPAKRVIRVMERLGGCRDLPLALRIDNGPELLAQQFVTWCERRGIELRYIQPGKPDQNAFIERFNRTYREEVLDSYVFEDLEQVREISAAWLRSYNEERPHEALGSLPPALYRERVLAAKNSTSELST